MRRLLGMIRAVSALALVLAILADPVEAIAEGSGGGDGQTYYQMMLTIFDELGLINDGYTVRNFSGADDWLRFCLNITETVVSPEKQRQLAMALESNYGYDVVAGNGNGLNTLDTDSGGAFTYNEFTAINVRKNVQVLCDWMDYIAVNGPEWPVSGGGGGANVPGNTEDGEYVRLALKKSLAFRSDLTKAVNFEGTLMGFGPQSLLEQSPEYIYLKVPKTYIDALASLLHDDYKLYAYVVADQGSSMGTQIWATYAANLIYEWQQLELQSNLNGDSSTIIVDCVRAGSTNSQGFYLGGNSYQTLEEELVFSAWNNWTSTRYMNVQNYGSRYISVESFDGTYTPQPEPEPDEPDPYPEPEPPSYDPPEPIEPPGDPTVTTQPDAGDEDIIERLDVIIQQLHDFQELFVGFRNDTIEFFGEIYDMLSEYLSDLYYRIRDTNSWLRAIYYELDSIDNRMARFRRWYEPNIDDGKTPQEQLETDWNELVGKFPFSLPWDILAMLSMLKADVVGDPVIELPYYFFGHTGSVTLDFSNYHAAGVASRYVSLWMFRFWLIMRTKQLLVEGV